MSSIHFIISCLCLMIVALFAGNADGQENPLAGLFGNCDVMKCVKPLMDLETTDDQPFNAVAFQQQCRLYPSVLKCLKREIKQCSIPNPMIQKFAMAAIDGAKDVSDYVCIEKQADFIEIAPCLLHIKDVTKAVTGCSLTMQQKLPATMMSIMSSQTPQSSPLSVMCSLLDEFLDCATTTVSVCGPKAVDILHEMDSRMTNHIMEEIVGQTCSMKENKSMAQWNADGQENPLTGLFGNCDVMKCVKPLMDLKPIDADVVAFQKRCGLSFSALKCVESEIKQCSIPNPMIQKIIKAVIDGVKEASDYVCVEKQSDVIELIPCLQHKDVTKALIGCSLTMQQKLLATMMSSQTPQSSPFSDVNHMMSVMCSLFDEFLDCATTTVSVCGPKAADIYHETNWRMINRIMEGIVGQKCSLKEYKSMAKSSDGKGNSVHTGVVIGVCVAVLFVVVVAIAVFVMLRRNKHQALTRRLLKGEQPPAYEDNLATNK